ncbi:M48 family metalloprotease [Solirubrobacter soli]|uniref:M48 family metalloprotease n=1 Tax=Solirubrobacter soli TaxID=363832 RepID=UPI0012F89E3E|nr:M48 family metalloprotease [Solirubrobacter soli]
MARRPGGRFARFAAHLGRSSGERMAARLRDAQELRAGRTPAKVLAYAVAAGVHVFTLALFVGGIAAVVTEFPEPFSILFGLAMVCAAGLMRPRVPGMPDGELLDPAAAPTLHALAGKVASALDRPPPSAIVADARWNASLAVVGWRRRRVLVVGVPLLAALGPDERVAMLAHEVGHDRNGDATRGLFVGSAVDGLDALAAALRPPRRAAAFEELGAVEWLAGALTWVLTRPVDAVLWLEARLLLRDMQRAEYLADAAAARVGGSAAAIALHERVLLHPTFQHAVQQAAIENDARGTLSRVRAALDAVPARERDRRRRVARLKHARLEDSHPPTGMRIALLEDRAPHPPMVTLTLFESERIDAELAPLEAAIGRALVDRYRAALHGHR